MQFEVSATFNRRLIVDLSNLLFQLKRYKTYVYLLSSHINSNPAESIIIIGANNPSTPTLGEDDELKPLGGPAGNHQQGTNRYSYRAAIYRSESQDIG